MTQWVLILGTISFALAGCSDSNCCNITHRSYHLSGNPPSGASACGTIVLDFYEDHSLSCGPSCSMVGQNPGKLILEKTTSSTSPWSADVTVYDSGKTDPQSIAIYANCGGSGDGDANYNPCVGYASVSAANHDGISLSPAPCPKRD